MEYTHNLNGDCAHTRHTHIHTHIVNVLWITSTITTIAPSITNIDNMFYLHYARIDFKWIQSCLFHPWTFLVYTIKNADEWWHHLFYLNCIWCKYICILSTTPLFIDFSHSFSHHVPFFTYKFFIPSRPPPLSFCLRSLTHYLLNIYSFIYLRTSSSPVIIIIIDILRKNRIIRMGIVGSTIFTLPYKFN